MSMIDTTPLASAEIVVRRARESMSAKKVPKVPNSSFHQEKKKKKKGLALGTFLGTLLRDLPKLPKAAEAARDQG